MTAGAAKCSDTNTRQNAVKFRKWGTEGRIITTTYCTLSDVLRLHPIANTRNYTVLFEKELVQKTTKF